MTRLRSRSEPRRERALEYKVTPRCRVLGYNLHCPSLCALPVYVCHPSQGTDLLTATEEARSSIYFGE